MYEVKFQKKILYKWPDEKLAKVHDNLTNNIETKTAQELEQAKMHIEEFVYLLYLRKIFAGELRLNYRKLANIVTKISNGAQLLKDHLANVNVSDPMFVIITNCLSLIVPTVIPAKYTGFEKGEDFSKTILHISDIHFGLGHKYYDDSYKNIPSEEIPTLLKDLVDDIKKQGLSDHTDFIVISGDLTWDGSDQDFKNARVFIEELLEKTNVSIDRCVVVPGNHDITWVDPEKGEMLPQRDAELPYKNFYELLFKKSPNEFLSRSVYADDVAIIGLNSARIEPSSHGIGFVGKNQIKREIDGLKGTHEYHKFIKVAVLHHHLLPVSQLETLPRDFDSHISLTLDCEGVIRELIRNGVAIVLHGHQHQPFFGVTRRFFKDKNLSYKELAICGAGSAAARKKYLPSFGRNHYNVLRISQRYFEVISRFTNDSGSGFQTHYSLTEWYT